MGVRHEHLANKIFCLGTGCDATLSSSFLRTVVGNRLGFGVTIMRNSDDHILLRNQVFHGQVNFAFNDLGATVVVVPVPDFL